MPTKLSKILNEKGLLVPLMNDLFISQGKNILTLSASDTKVAKKLLEIQSNRDETVRDNFRASASGSCMREQVLGLTHKPDVKLPPTTIAIFDDGNWRNVKWVVMFNKLGTLVEYEKKGYSDKYDMGYTPDAILDLSKHYPDLEGSNRVGVEVKGMHDFEWKQFKGGVANSRWAIGRHFQTHAYMLATGAKFWIAWGENKNTQQYAEQVIKRNPETIKYLKQRYDYMNRGRSKKLLPAIECELHSSDTKFRYCRQSTTCIKLKEEKAKRMKPMPDRAKSERSIARIIGKMI